MHDHWSKLEEGESLVQRVPGWKRKEGIHRSLCRRVPGVGPFLTPIESPENIGHHPFRREEVVVEQPLLTVDRQMGLNIVHPEGKVSVLIDHVVWSWCSDKSSVRQDYIQKITLRQSDALKCAAL